MTDRCDDIGNGSVVVTQATSENMTKLKPLDDRAEYEHDESTIKNKHIINKNKTTKKKT